MHAAISIPNISNPTRTLTLNLYIFDEIKPWGNVAGENNESTLIVGDWWLMVRFYHFKHVYVYK